jgi:hypothetical protein
MGYLNRKEKTMGEGDSTEAQDARRYRWLGEQFAKGKETNIGEFIMSKQDLDERIDREMAKEE